MHRGIQSDQEVLLCRYNPIQYPIVYTVSLLSCYILCFHGNRMLYTHLIKIQHSIITWTMSTYLIYNLLVFGGLCWYPSGLQPSWYIPQNLLHSRLYIMVMVYILHKHKGPVHIMSSYHAKPTGSVISLLGIPNAWGNLWWIDDLFGLSHIITESSLSTSSTVKNPTYRQYYKMM